MKRKILIICHNNLEKAPRFLMEVNGLKKDYMLYAAGLSGNSSADAPYKFIDLTDHPTPKFHLKWPRLPKKAVSLFILLLFNLRKKIKKLTYEQLVFNYEYKLLKKYDFDLIIVHHLSALTLALKLVEKKKLKVILNAHEYYPKEFEDNAKWMRTTGVQYLTICQKYLHKVNAIFSVGKRISAEYKKEYNVDSIVITNSKKFVNYTPKQNSGNNIAIVHHGALIKSRGIEEMIKMMHLIGDTYTLDMMLTIPNSIDEDYLGNLKKLTLLEKNINFNSPVPTSEIIEKINNYDIGCFLLQPSNFNYRYALPNKFFEFIQARLAIAIGPSPEMADLVKKYDLGVVATEFTAASMAAEIKKLTPENIMYYKNQCDKYAYELSAAKDEALILQTVNSLINS